MGVGAPLARLDTPSSTQDLKPLQMARCTGTRKGAPCRKLLAEMELTAGSEVRIKCGSCNQLNVIAVKTAG